MSGRIPHLGLTLLHGPGRAMAAWAAPDEDERPKPSRHPATSNAPYGTEFTMILYLPVPLGRKWRTRT